MKPEIAGLDNNENLHNVRTNSDMERKVRPMHSRTPSPFSLAWLPEPPLTLTPPEDSGWVFTIGKPENIAPAHALQGLRSPQVGVEESVMVALSLSSEG